MHQKRMPLPGPVTVPGQFTVVVERSAEPAVVLTEKSVFGVTSLSFSAEEAKQVGLYLLRAAASLSAEAAEEEEEFPLQLVAAR